MKGSYSDHRNENVPKILHESALFYCPAYDKLYINKYFLYVALPFCVQLVVLFCSSITVLFDIPGITRCCSAGSHRAVGSTSDFRATGPGFHTRSGHILSFLLPLIEEGQLSVTDLSMCTKF